MLVAQVAGQVDMVPGGHRWAGLVFGYMETTVKPGFTGVGLASKSAVVGLGPGST